MGLMHHTGWDVRGRQYSGLVPWTSITSQGLFPCSTWVEVRSASVEVGVVDPREWMSLCLVEPRSTPKGERAK